MLKKTPGCPGFIQMGFQIAVLGHVGCGAGWWVRLYYRVAEWAGGIAVFSLLFFSLKNGGENVYIPLLPHFFFRCLLSRENPSQDHKTPGLGHPGFMGSPAIS